MGDKSELLSRTGKAIHTLFYATEAAHDRYKAIEASLTTDDELAAFQALSIGLINLDPIDPQVLAGLRTKAKEIVAAADAPPKTPSERIEIEAHPGDEGVYFKRLLLKMYANWDGTLDYESGKHRLTFYSPFDEELRRHTSFAHVSVDGVCPDLFARNYVLGPYLLAEDHRTKVKSDDPWRVLGGDLSLLLPAEEAA